VAVFLYPERQQAGQRGIRAVVTEVVRRWGDA
jgi:hypothetical protein